MRPECPDPDTLDLHENPRAHQKVDPTSVGDTVNFPQHDPRLAPQEPETTLPPPIGGPERPRARGNTARGTTTQPPTQPPQPTRPRPSVGVPARFPDQQPVVLFNPADFTVRPPVVPQNTDNRFVPLTQQTAQQATPPPFVPFNFENPFNDGFTQFTQVIGPTGSIVSRPTGTVINRPIQPEISRPIQPQISRPAQPEVFQGDRAMVKLA